MKYSSLRLDLLLRTFELLLSVGMIFTYQQLLIIMILSNDSIPDSLGIAFMNNHNMNTYNNNNEILLLII